MGLDRKYGRVTTEFGDIPEDEPVIVFRGRDAALPQTLDAYIMGCQWVGASDAHIRLVMESASKIREWQATHPERVVVPSSKAYFERTAADQAQ